MKDWKAYFKTRLTKTGMFILDSSSRHGQTEILTFKNFNLDKRTTIQLGILDNGDLITFEIHNPLTPGFSKQQKREYFYKYSFHPTESYGDPGLEFIQLNIDHFEKLLTEGLNGKEIQYFKNGRLMRSDVFQGLTESGDDFGITIQFQKEGFWKRILDTFKSKGHLYDSQKEIELKEIFDGVGT
ncbi:MAG TPA: hypothetical protein VFE50_16500 [Cyclobacteriaceae bacterium]|nr:hypothetical protein [Cyclobacteriaceae bacterium]